MERRSDRSNLAQLEQARLAFLSAGQPPLAGARQPDDEEADLIPPEQASPEPQLLLPAAAAAEPAGGPLSWWHPTRAQAIVVALILLCGVVVAVISVNRSAATDVAPIEVSSAPSPTLTPSASVAPTARVHVAGAVAAPGVVTVPEGSIVLDAIEAAGGLSENADPAELNLAAPVTDGQQIIIGTSEEPQGEVRGDSAPAEGGTQADGLVHLNAATQEQLETLPGVGPVLATAILSWRDDNGDFTDIAQLQEVSGIGPKTYAKLEPLVHV